jgi:hypothetical protein
MHAIDQQVFCGAETLSGCDVLTLCWAVDDADISTHQVFGWTNTNSPTLQSCCKVGNGYSVSDQAR